LLTGGEPVLNMLTINKEEAPFAFTKISHEAGICSDILTNQDFRGP